MKINPHLRTSSFDPILTTLPKRGRGRPRKEDAGRPSFWHTLSDDQVEAILNREALEAARAERTPDDFQTARWGRLLMDKAIRRPLAVVGYNENAVCHLMRHAFGLWPQPYVKRGALYSVFRRDEITVRWLRDPSEFSPALNIRTVFKVDDPTGEPGPLDQVLTNWTNWHHNPRVVRPVPYVLDLRSWVYNIGQPEGPTT